MNKSHRNAHTNITVIIALKWIF